MRRSNEDKEEKIRRKNWEGNPSWMLVEWRDGRERFGNTRMSYLAKWKSLKNSPTIIWKSIIDIN